MADERRSHLTDARAPARAGRPLSIGAAIALIAVATAAVATLVGIGGEFPLSDDWSYAFATRALCTTGSLRFLAWTGASLVLQAAYGAALCRLLGFSFVVLRASTVALAGAGVVGMLLLLRRAGVRGPALALGTVVFALNPLYLNLAFTFMTDVPFTVAAVWAGWAYLRGLDERRPELLLVGSLFATAALLIRQHGILVAGAATVTSLALAGRPWRGRLRDAGLASALPVLAFVAFHLWLVFAHGTPGGYLHKVTEAQHVLVARVANCGFRGLAYLGFFLAPIALAIAAPLRARHPRALASWCGALAAVALALWFRERTLMPYLTNVVYDLGLGALSLRDTLFLGEPPPLMAGPALTAPVTVVAILAAGVLCAAWTTAAARLRAPGPAFLIVATALLFAGTLLQTRYYFDRYLVAVVPFAIAATLALAPPLRAPRTSVALAALLGWYAIAGTHDYLAWNRARFAGLAHLTEAGVAVTEIDGGFEFNGWHLAPTLDRWPTDEEVRPGRPATVRSWWWVVDDRFVASFRPLAGYTVREALPYQRWLVPGTGRVLILERTPG